MKPEKIIAVILLLLTASCTGKQKHGEIRISEDRRRFTINIAEEYRGGALHIPEKLNRKNPPLIIALHPMGSSGEAFRSRGFDLTADRYGFIVVYPDGQNGGWSTLNDNAFLEMIIDRMHEKYKIDRKKVFMTGHSLGAIQCYESALVLTGKIAGIAAVSGTMSAGSAQLIHVSCPAITPIVPAALPVMHIHSLDDEIIPFEGKHLWNIYSVDETMAFWKKINGCAGEPQEYPASPDITGRLWRGSGADCVLLLRQSGGHGWPGCATELISDFFERISAVDN